MNNRTNFIFFWLLAFCFLLTSCDKNDSSITFTELNSGIDRELNTIVFVDDLIGFTIGGDRYFKGDILKTTDGGITWSEMIDTLPKELFDIDFVNSDTGFIAGFEGEIYSTTNQGMNWNFYQDGYWTPFMADDFTDSKHGVMVGGVGYVKGIISRTNDGGASWTADTFSNELQSVTFANQQIGFAGGYGIILKTTDGGETWNATSAVGDFFISLFFFDEHTGFALGREGTLLKTTDGGSNWKKLINGNSLFNGEREMSKIIFRDEQTGYIIGNKGCFMKTTDGGEHWDQVKESPEVDLKGICLISNGGYVCGAGGKIFQFADQ